MHMHNKQFITFKTFQQKVKNYKSRMAHTSIRTGAPQVTYFVTIQGKTLYEGPRRKYIVTEHFLLVD